MPYALSTTKRKFHQILDSISNSSSTSLALKDDRHNGSTFTLPTNLETPAKKPRLVRPVSALVPSTTLNAANQVSALRTTKRRSISPTMNGERNSPNFAPWDRTQFLERLKTFRHVSTWMGKPEKINEVQWAKRGWSCVGKERVGCVGGCGKEVVIKLEDDRNQVEPEESEASTNEDEDWREGAQEQLIEKYAETIIAGHDGGCLWRRRGCDDTIYRLPLAHQATTLNGLRLRYESLVAIYSDLPSTLSTPPSFTLSASHRLSQVFHPSVANSTTSPATPPSDSSPPIPINHEALILALFGWQAEPSQISGLVSCPACFRRLGLWLFKSPTPPASPSMTRLDVLTEHRDYCPWINPNSQSLGTSTPDTQQPHQPRSSTSGLAGWEILLRVVNNHAQLLRAGITSRPAPSWGPDPAGVYGDGESEGARSGSAAGESGDAKARDARDSERWAKLKKLKQVFHVKRGKGKGKGRVNEKRPDQEGGMENTEG